MLEWNALGFVPEKVLRECLQRFQAELRALATWKNQRPSLWLRRLSVYQQLPKSSYTFVVANDTSLRDPEAQSLADQALRAFLEKTPGAAEFFFCALDHYGSAHPCTEEMRQERDRVLSFLAAYTARRTPDRYRDGEQILWLHEVEPEGSSLVATFCVEYSYDESEGAEFARRAASKLRASSFAPPVSFSATCDRYR
jgi:hypothetical protein